MGSFDAATLAVAEKRVSEREYRFGEIEFLTEQGMSLVDAVAAVGWSVAAAEIAARRSGRHELSRLLGRQIVRER